MVKDGNTTLTPDQDYTIKPYTGDTDYKKTEVSTTPYKFIVEGKNNYSGTYVLTWNITPLSFTDDKLTASLKDDSEIYNGTEINIVDLVSGDNNGYDNLVVKYGDTVLVGGRDFTVSNAKQTAVGDYTLTLTGIGNYTGTETVKWNIKQKEIAIDWTGDSFIYNGKDQKATGAIKDGSVISGDTVNLTVSYKDSKAADITESVNVGSYQAIAAIDNENYKISATDITHSYTIVAKKLDDSDKDGINAELIDDEVEYSGAEIDITENGNLVVTYNGMTLVEGTDFTVTGNKGTDAGNYVVEITAIPGGNYSGSTTVTWKIGNGRTIPGIGADSVDVVYDGKAYSITVTGTQTGDKVLYSLTGDKGSFVAENPSFTDFTNGKVIVYYTVDRTNYDTKRSYATVNIKAKEVGLIWTHLDDLVYNGEAQLPSVVVNTDDLVTAADKSNVIALIDANSAQINAGGPYDTSADLGGLGYKNYVIKAADVNRQFYIGSKNLGDKEIDAKLNPDSFLYTGFDIDALKEGKLSVTYGRNTLVEGTHFTISGGTTKAKEIGSYTMTITAVSGSGYTGSRDIVWKISSKQTMPTPSIDADPEYNGQPQSPVFENLPDGSTVIYRNPETGNFDTVTDPVTGKEVSKYVPELTNVTDDPIKNIDYMIVNPAYDPSFGNIPEFKIDPKEIAIEWGNTELVYNGENQQPTAVAAGVIAGDLVNIQVIPDTADRKSVNVGDYIAIPVITNPNYKLPSNPNKGYSIKNKPTIPGIKDIPVDCTYDGTDHSIQITGTQPGDVVMYSTSPDGPWSTTPITRRNVTDETIYYRVERAGYEPFTGYSSLKISPKEIQIAWSNLEPVYDGTIKTPIAEALGLIFGDTAVITVSGGSAELGVHEAVAIAISNPNYKLPSNSGVKFEVKNGGHVHIFDQRVVSNIYLCRMAGNCIAPNLYYYSCTCGEKGTETFEFGNGAHFVYYVGIIKEPTYDEEGLESYHCMYCNYHYELPIPKLEKPEPTPIVTPEPTPIVTPEPEPDEGGDGSLDKYVEYFKDFTTLVLTGQSVDESSVMLNWVHHGPADYFVIKYNKCNTETETYYVEEYARVGSDVTSLLVEGLEKGRFYKFAISAWKYEDDGTVRKLGRSLLIDVTTDGGLYTNAEHVKLTGKLEGKRKVSLKTGTSMDIDAEITSYQNEDSEYHINMALEETFRYEAVDKGIVSFEGNVMTGNKAGTTDVYVFAQDGAYAKITVTVR